MNRHISLNVWYWRFWIIFTKSISHFKYFSEFRLLAADKIIVLNTHCLILSPALPLDLSFSHPPSISLASPSSPNLPPNNPASRITTLNIAKHVSIISRATFRFSRSSFYGCTLSTSFAILKTWWGIGKGRKIDRISR